MTRAKVLPLPYQDNVFINCPFDTEYKPLFYAMVFAIHDAGFVARCALEAIDSGTNRLSKIARMIEECKYGVHDISRTELSPVADLPRFNMPYECGLFWGCLFYGKPDQRKQKRLLVLDNIDYRYRTSISDIAGQDIAVHNDNPEELIDRIRTWLHNGSGKTGIPGGAAIWEHYQRFQNDLPLILAAAKITTTELEKPTYYGDYIQFVVDWLTLNT